MKPRANNKVQNEAAPAIVKQTENKSVMKPRAKNKVQILKEAAPATVKQAQHKLEATEVGVKEGRALKPVQELKRAEVGSASKIKAPPATGKENVKRARQ